MNKFKKATQKITAIAAATTLVSSAFAVGDLSSYFVEDGVFEASVVVGTDSAASDMTAASNLIAALAADYSGESSKVKIVARKSAEGGDSVSAVDTKETLNYGETLASVAEELDKDVSDLLEDGSVDNNDYTQELFLLNGDFDYRIFDEVDGEDTAKSGLYYDAGQSFAKYTVDFEDDLDIATTADKDDLVGETMDLMGNEFTIVEIDEETLVLIGGSNKIALGEGESSTVSVDGDSYDVEVLSVSDEQVLVSVNGQTKTIDEYDTENVAGISVAAVDLQSSSRDSVAGYAQLVIGGQKVELETSGVKINDEDLDDVYEDFEADVTFLGTNSDNVFAGFEITYLVDENTVLEIGDSLEDFLFGSFAITYEGTNDVEYTDLVISTSKDEISFNGELFDGTEIPSEFKLTTDDTTSAQLYLGSDTERIYFQGSDLGGVTALVQSGNLDAINYNADNVTVEFNLSATTTDVKDNMFFSLKDDDEFYLYEITGIDRDDLEVDFTDIIGDKDTNAVDIDDVQSSLEFNSGVASNTSGVLELDTSNLGTPELYLANELMMNFANVETSSLTSSSADVNLTFRYNSDVEMDDTSYESDAFGISIQRASDEDDALELSLFRSSGSWQDTDEVEEDSDFDVYVDHYGTMVTIDTEDKDDVTISVPEEEVEAMVTVSFGSAATASTQTWTVDESEVESTKEELEEDGWTIVSTEAVATEEVEFNVESAILDSEASGMDMIVIGGPAVNSVARDLLGIESYDVSQAGVAMGEGVARYFADSNSVLIYGYSAADTTAIVNEVSAGTANIE